MMNTIATNPVVAAACPVMVSFVSPSSSTRTPISTNTSPSPVAAAVIIMDEDLDHSSRTTTDSSCWSRCSCSGPVLHPTKLGQPQKHQAQMNQRRNNRRSSSLSCSQSSKSSVLGSTSSSSKRTVEEKALYEHEIEISSKEYAIAIGYLASDGCTVLFDPVAQYEPTASSPPKRPLSAYNLYFHLQRQHILRRYEEETDDIIQPPNVEVEYTIHDIIEFAQQQNEDYDEINNGMITTTTKRKHRKTHGKISFTSLARLVATRWKQMSIAQKCIFHGYFKIEMSFYKQRYDIWTQYCQDHPDEKGMASDATETKKKTKKYNTKPKHEKNNQKENVISKATKTTDMQREDDEEKLQATCTGSTVENDKETNNNMSLLLGPSSFLQRRVTMDYDGTRLSSSSAPLPTSLLLPSSSCPIDPFSSHPSQQQQQQFMGSASLHHERPTSLLTATTAPDTYEMVDEAFDYACTSLLVPTTTTTMTPMENHYQDMNDHMNDDDDDDDDDDVILDTTTNDNRIEYRPSSSRSLSNHDITMIHQQQQQKMRMMIQMELQQRQLQQRQRQQVRQKMEPPILVSYPTTTTTNSNNATCISRSSMMDGSCSSNKTSGNIDQLQQILMVQQRQMMQQQSCMNQMMQWMMTMSNTNNNNPSSNYDTLEDYDDSIYGDDDEEEENYEYNNYCNNMTRDVGPTSRNRMDEGMDNMPFTTTHRAFNQKKNNYRMMMFPPQQLQLMNRRRTMTQGNNGQERSIRPHGFHPSYQSVDDDNNNNKNRVDDSTIPCMTRPECDNIDHSTMFYPSDPNSTYPDSD
jgi:hypothetical protein